MKPSGYCPVERFHRQMRVGVIVGPGVQWIRQCVRLLTLIPPRASIQSSQVHLDDSHGALGQYRKYFCIDCINTRVWAALTE